MTFVDANIFMYAAGVDHPYKQPSVGFLRRVAAGEIEACTDAEVLQEILHRYRAIGRWADGRRVFGLVLATIPVVLPIDRQILEDAVVLLDRYPTIMARDALHAAACTVHGIHTFCSFDRDFDLVTEVARSEP